MRIHYLLLFLLLILSCKKEKDVKPPVIAIDSPYDGQLVTGGDTIQVQGSVLSEADLVSVTINLLDKDMTSVVPSVTVKVSGKSAVFNEQIITLNTLPAGDYYLQVVASSLVEKTRKYNKINLSSSAGKKRLYLAFTETSNNTYLYSFDTSYSAALKQTFVGKYYSSATFGATEPYLGISFYNEDLHAISLKDNSIKWTLPRYNSMEPTYKGVFGYGDYLYVAHSQDHLVKAFDKNKAVMFSSYVSSTYNPDDIFIGNDHLFIDEMPVVNSDTRKLSVKFMPSGSGYQETNTGFDIVTFIQKNSDEIYVFGNEGQQGRMEIYSVSANGYYSVHSLPAVPVLKAVRINNDDLVILTSDEIFTYRYSTNSMVPYLALSAKTIEYDSERNELLVATGNQVKIYNYSSKQIKRTVTLNATVLDIKLTAL